LEPPLSTSHDKSYSSIELFTVDPPSSSSSSHRDTSIASAATGREKRIEEEGDRLELVDL
jgi:hypothetical protein